MRHQKPSVIALNALLDGQRVEIDRTVWGMGEDNTLYIVAHDDQGNERLLRNPLPLHSFIYMCETLSEEKLAELSANAVLNQRRG